MAITIDTSIATILPAYNPIIATFSSTNVALQGFRYLVDIYNTDTNEVISQQKIVPQIDGTGKVDVARILSNYVTVDFVGFMLPTDNAENSYFNYNVKIGEEYQTPAWNFTSISSFTSSTTNLIYTKLNGATNAPYVVNDQILIRTSATTNPLYGLHKVIASGSNYVVVNVLYTGGTTTGATMYADGRKSAFSGLTSITGLTVFNGVSSFEETFNYSTNIVNVGTPNTIREMLTDLPLTNTYATPNQMMWFNVMITKTSPYGYCLVAESSNGESATTQCVSSTNTREATQFPFSFTDTNFNLATTDWVDLYIGRTNFGATERLTKKYRIFQDKRCVINDYEIAFMDRKGSIGSFAFQLRKKETGTIERIQYKKQVPDSFIQTYDAGTTNIWIGVQKELELNTNWMSEEMNIYFEQLLSSPYTWVKTDENANYFACTIVDTSFEIEFQNNKRLIRKTVKIRFANTDAVNI